ncbi:MAG: hypothetical protein ACRDSN_14720, partial [Pseudonocardiaceae bacterium]
MLEDASGAGRPALEHQPEEVDMAQAIEATLDQACSGMERSLTGRILRPGGAAYDEACTLFNSMIDKRPAVIAQCATPEDVAAALLFGREHGLE